MTVVIWECTVHVKSSLWLKIEEISRKQTIFFMWNLKMNCVISMCAHTFTVVWGGWARGVGGGGGGIALFVFNVLRLCCLRVCSLLLLSLSSRKASDEWPYIIAFEFRIYYVHTLLLACFEQANPVYHASFSLLLLIFFPSFFHFVTDTTALHTGQSMWCERWNKTINVYNKYVQENMNSYLPES